MDYRPMGSTGVKVSSLCLGAMTFGEADEKSFMHKACCDEATSQAILNRALSAGINFIDTADVYGQDGLSERVIGNWFAKDKRRDDVVLATKCRFRMSDGPNGTGASRFRILRACEASLRRLQTDRIDLYQIHMQDMETPEEETLRALDDLVRSGKVLYIGCSNYAAYRLVRSLWISERERISRYCTLQAQYSLVSRELERELVPACRELGLGILPWSPLAAGFLSGKYRKDQEVPSGTRFERERWKPMGRFGERHWRILEAVEAVGRELGRTPAQVSLAWLRQQPQVTSVIFGARSVAQLEDNLAAAEITLGAAELSALDEASAFDVGYPYSFMKTIQGGW